MFRRTTAVVMSLGLLAPPAIGAAPRGKPINEIRGSQSFTGADAARLLKEKKEKNASFEQALREGAEQLAAYGYKPTGKVTIFRNLGDESKPKRLFDRILDAVMPRLAAQTAYGPGFEIGWISWDDGNPASWEGQVYIYTAEGEYGVYNQQTDVSGAGDYMMPYWSYTTHYYRPPYLPEASAERPQVTLAQYRIKKPYQPDWGNFYLCAFRGCGIAAAVCPLAGPAAPECFVAGCTAALIDCGLGYLLGWKA